jgi:hypothetical protein
MAGASIRPNGRVIQPKRTVFFTEVGCYSPLTGKPVLRATEAYVLHRQAAFVIGLSNLGRRVLGAQGVRLMAGPCQQSDERCHAQRAA